LSGVAVAETRKYLWEPAVTEPLPRTASTDE
jgi:hypothetical protein